MAIVIDGNNTPTAGGIGYGDGTELAFTTAGSAGGVLYSAGSSAPAFSAAGSSGGVLYSAGSSAPAFSAAGTSGQLLQSNGASAPTWATVSAGYTLGTPVAVSGSALIEFTSLPAGIKNIIVTFYRVSLGSGVTDIGLQLGKTAGYATSATQSQSVRIRDPAAGAFSFDTSTFQYLPVNSGGDTAFYNGQIILTLVDSTNNFWAAQGTLGSTVTASIFLSSASINLGDTLTKLKITSAGNFDGGTLNIAYI